MYTARAFVSVRDVECFVIAWSYSGSIDCLELFGVKEACEDGSEQHNEKQVGKLWKKKSNVRARGSLKLAADGGADGRRTYV